MPILRRGQTTSLPQSDHSVSGRAVRNTISAVPIAGSPVTAPAPRSGLTQALQTLGISRLQARGHTNHNQSTTGQTRGGRAGNSSQAADVHATPGKTATPAPALANRVTGRSGATTSSSAAQRTTTQAWGQQAAYPHRLPSGERIG